MIKQYIRMNQLLYKGVNLYAKSLIVAVPTGMIVANYEQIEPIGQSFSYPKRTCAGKIFDSGMGTIGPTCYNTMVGWAGAMIYPITAPLYLTHKLEQYNPNIFQVCHQND